MIDLPPLNLPPVDLKIRREGNLLKVYDRLRDKFVTLTPEEFVRQHFTAYLINQLHYPPSIMANEVAIKLNETLKRCDTVIFDHEGTPLLIAEYKAPNVAVSQSVFDQIVRYNMKLKARYLVVSNGLSHYCCVNDYDKDTYHFIRRIPDYKDINTPFSEN